MKDSIIFRCSSDLHNRLREAAKKEQLPLGSFIRLILINSLKRRQRWSL